MLGDRASWALLASLALAVGLMAFFLNPIWVAVMVSAALAYGLMSSIVAARRLYFLAGASAHSALLAVVLAIPLAELLGLMDERSWALLMGLLLIYAVGYMIHRGADPDVATSVFVAATASASSLAIYYVLTRFPTEAELWAIIVGDPLLSSQQDAFYALGVASLTALAVILTYREQVYIGLDREFMRLSGVRTWAYDLLVFTCLGLVTVSLIRVVGFVLEHVLLLLPSAVATRLVKSSGEVLLASTSISLAASLLGLLLAVSVDLSPAGIVGLVLLTAYLSSLLAGRWAG
ncbi:metal ABC transporter permease [Candidatus Bathyarchaeota archaeon]|nr:MAG: metal ABC transporter permease [Candidatus Bathyarchaeota archaeon]